ncbi:MAG: hypothetical protein M3535_02905 [Actinomycetota bacterium]|nr:hypothetical protein [Actinomycetota bacterium]
MPEGDTIFRTARALHRALAGRVLVRFEARRLSYEPFPPTTVVTGVEARGKHCLIHFDDGRILRTHLRMSGSWHLYRPGERWRKQPTAARAVVEVGPRAGDDQGWVAVCFAAPIVELIDGHDGIGTDHLGPDLCRPNPDLDEAVRRIDRFSPPSRLVIDVLLDQRVAAGVGNVYKSEACFACRLHPSTPIVEVTGDQRQRLLATASEQLRANLDRPDRVTLEGGLAVYGRAGLPCRRCATTIAWARQGEDRRGTYWCPDCQRR